MKTYRVLNKVQKEFAPDLEAESPEDACKKVGWSPNVCLVKVKTDKGGWANVTTGEIDEKLTAEEKTKLTKVAKQTQEAPVKKVLGQPTEAESKGFERRLHIMQLAQGAQSMFLEMGGLLYGVKEDAEWSIMHYESFKEYVEDLKLPMQNSYSWATRLIGIHQYLIIAMNIPEAMLIEIGVAKLTRLLPAARDGRLTMDMIEQAKILSDMDLRELLGHNVGGGSGSDTDFIVCPRCGESFDAKKAQRAS